MPLAVQYMPISQILDSFEQLGINSIRLQWSNEMFHDTSIVQDDWVKANPQFRGMTALQIYDECVRALTARGFAVILNNHTNKSKWCCGVNNGNERWNESQNDDAWMDDWVAMVKRYKYNPRVVAADPYNEVCPFLFFCEPNSHSGLNRSEEIFSTSPTGILEMTMTGTASLSCALAESTPKRIRTSSSL
jgi:aryl-phospho-beta-D-glucosidase BglC (GH1 family)